VFKVSYERNIGKAKMISEQEPERSVASKS